MPSSHAGASFDAPCDIYLDTHRMHPCELKRLTAQGSSLTRSELGLAVGIVMLAVPGPLRKLGDS